MHHAYANGGGTLLVDGLSGMGKTHFLRSLAMNAEEHNHWPVIFVSADRLEMHEPYSFIERFLAAGVAPQWNFEPEAEQQPIAVARQCVRALLGDSLGGAEGRIVIIDDAHWIDASSVLVLRHMIPRFNRRNVLIVCGARSPHDASSLGEHLAAAAQTNPHDHHVHLQPLTAQDIQALAMRRFRVSISKRNAEHLAEITGGSYLGVESIFDQVTDDEIRQLHTTWDLPIRSSNLKNPLLRTFLDLSPEAQRVAQLICLAEHDVSPTLLHEVAEVLDIDPTIDEAVRAGVVMESDFGRSIVPQHALIAAAVRETIPRDFARRAHAALAERTQGLRSVHHTLKSATSWSPQLMAQTEFHVQQAIDRGHDKQASDILRMALELADNTPDRQQLITELVLLNLLARTGFRCLDLLPEIENFPPSILREFLAVMLYIYLLNDEFPQHRVQAALDTPATTPEETTLQSYLLFVMILWLMRHSDRRTVQDYMGRAQALFAAAPQHPEELTDTRLAWMVAPQAHALFLDCLQLSKMHLDGELERAQETLPTLLDRVAELPDIAIKIDCLVPLAGAAAANGHVLLAHDISAQAVELLDRVAAQPWAAATPHIILANSLVLLGKYRRAISVLDLLDKLSHDTLDLEARLTAAALRASIAAITKLHDPEQYLAHARRLKNLKWDYYGQDLPLLANLELASINDRPTDIIDQTAATETAGFRITQRGYLTYRAHALITLGDLDNAQALIDQLQQEQGTTWFESWGTLSWLQARLAAARDDTTTARSHFIAALKQRLFPLPWALTALDYGDFLLANAQPEAAETVLRDAVAMLEKIGADAYLDRAKGHLAKALELSRTSQTNALAAMTKRELEVAELLAAGYSNKTIAEHLVVSESTARFHVSNILRKLQLSSRAEVPRVFRSAMRH